MLIAERFGKWPWELDDAPADRFTLMMNVLGIQGEARAAMHGLEPNEPLYYFDEDE